MPPAKAGRLANAYVSSFPVPPAFVRSPSHGQYQPGVSPYHSPPTTIYGSVSPPPPNPYAYSLEAAAPGIGGPYPAPPPPPMSYPPPPYAGYGGPAYQPAYY